MQISAKTEDGKSVTVDFDFGNTLQEKVDKFGEDVVDGHIQRAFTLSLQSWLRGQLRAGKSAEDIQKEVQDWKPGARRAAKTPLQKAMEELEKMSPEERAEVKKNLRG